MKLLHKCFRLWFENFRLSLKKIMLIFLRRWKNNKTGISMKKNVLCISKEYVYCFLKIQNQMNCWIWNLMLKFCIQSFLDFCKEDFFLLKTIIVKIMCVIKKQYTYLCTFCIKIVLFLGMTIRIGILELCPPPDFGG